MNIERLLLSVFALHSSLDQCERAFLYIFSYGAPCGTGCREWSRIPFRFASFQRLHPSGFHPWRGARFYEISVVFKLNSGRDFKKALRSIFAPFACFARAKAAGSLAALANKVSFPSGSSCILSFFAGFSVLPPAIFARVKPLAASRPCKNGFRQSLLPVKKRNLAGVRKEP